MSVFVSLPRGRLPYSFVWEILFATVVAVGLVLALTWPSFGKKWMFFLSIIGVAEFEFSSGNYLAAGMIIGIVTAFTGLIVPVLYLTKPLLRKSRVKIFLILSGCLELITGSLGIQYHIFASFVSFIMYFGLITTGSCSLIVGVASLFSARLKQQPLLTGADSQIQPKKRSRRFYVILLAAVLLSVETVGVAIFEFSISGKIYYGPGPVEIEVTTDKPYYLQGEKVNFVIIVNNPQDWPVMAPLEVGYAIEKDGLILGAAGVYIDYAMYDVPTFPAHSRTLYNPPLIWSQEYLNGTNVQVPPGNYTVTIFFGGYYYDDSANCTVEIRQN
jgi:hypothetical protein